MIRERCKNCGEEFDSGIWVGSQFANEKVYLFCSDKCRIEFLKCKLEKIRLEYPSFYDKLKRSSGKGTIFSGVIGDG